MVKEECRRCHVEMKPGIAIISTLVAGLPDFPGDVRGVTLSEGGPGELVKVMKCPKCGHSYAADYIMKVGATSNTGGERG